MMYITSENTLYYVRKVIDRVPIQSHFLCPSSRREVGRKIKKENNDPSQQHYFSPTFECVAIRERRNFIDSTIYLWHFKFFPQVTYAVNS